jgi:DNA-binding MarR family transcriptional regulator
MLSMTEQSSAGADRRIERAIVLVLLSEKDEPRCSCAQLERALQADVSALERALERLSEAGLIGRAGAELWASSAARHLDELGLIAI